jgi:hypothetical protein
MAFAGKYPCREDLKRNIPRNKNVRPSTLRKVMKSVELPRGWPRSVPGKPLTNKVVAVKNQVEVMEVAE